MDLISHPDDKVFEVLFAKNGGIVPSAALNFNELNLMVGRYVIVLKIT